MAQLRLPGLIVPPEWLAQHMPSPELRLLDVRSRESYLEGHLPGAVWVDLPALARTVDGVPGMLLSEAEFADHMGALGVDQESVVVAYDDNWGMPAARVLWGLARYGHSQAALLTGGWDRWRQEERPQTQEIVTPRPTHFVSRAADDQLAERAWIMAHLPDDQIVLVDTRTAGEFAQGHLPGAVRWDWMNAVPATGWDAVRPAPELQADLAAHGITPDKEIVTYCRSGARAAHTYLILRHLGYPRVRNYDGSWLEWSHLADTPQGPESHKGDAR